MKLNRSVRRAGLCLLLCAAACTSVHNDHEAADTFTVTSPLRTDTSFAKDYVAQIRSRRNIELRAQEKGYLEAIFVDEGQSVKAGQLLFRIMPKLYEAEYRKAQAEARAAEIEYENTRVLADKKVVSPNELAMAAAKLERERAEVSLAKLHLSFTEIRAPFDGSIDRIPLKLGSLIDEGALLSTLSDNGQVFAYFNVSEPEYLDYKTSISGRAAPEVQLLLANNTPLRWPGTVETIESEFNAETGNIAFRARFPNPDGLLRHGETGKVRMTVPLRNALLIPQKATYEIQDKVYVFVVDGKGVIHSRNVQVAAQLPDVYAISSGLDTTDHILLEGVQKVKDDNKIETRFMAPRQVLASLRVKAE
ncbi:MAG: efflux RND transporter periplasmic adaptor subunit [Chitinophagaceae bacterium]|nr:MAG: efflux RND transporter periplasmic adaptor subunit [Chitinophagaceae bacterium]